MDKRLLILALLVAFISLGSGRPDTVPTYQEDKENSIENSVLARMDEQIICGGTIRNVFYTGLDLWKILMGLWDQECRARSVCEVVDSFGPSVNVQYASDWMDYLRTFPVSEDMKDEILEWKKGIQNGVEDDDCFSIYTDCQFSFIKATLQLVMRLKKCTAVDSD